jgi:hypothetical protein
MGFCAGFDSPGSMNPMPGLGRGMAPGRGGGRGFWGRGGGRGWRHWFYATGLPRWARGGGAVPAEPDVAALKQQAEDLEAALKDVRSRVRELESTKTNE